MSLNSWFQTMAASVCFAAVVHAQSPPPTQPTAITQVRLEDNVDAPLVSILIENGRITKILPAGDELPPGVIEVDAEGGLAIPAFVDGYTTTGIETPEPVGNMDAMSPLAGNVHIGMREANRKGLQPSMRGVQHFELDDDGRAKYRDVGFGAIHSSPSGQVLGGQTVVTALGKQALRDRVLVTDVFQAAAFSASGSGYPGTLMGYLAHLRQFMLDARWHALRLERVAAGKPDRRPPFDADLEAIAAVLNGEQALLCHADSAGDILRWLKFAELQNVKVIIGGGREAWRVTDELSAARVPVLLGLDWGDEVDDPDADEEDDEEEEGEESPEAEAEAAPEEPAQEPGNDSQVRAEEDPEAVAEVDQAETADEEATDDEAAEEEPDWIYEEPIEIRRERRRLWEERRDCALRLNEAGVTFAFGTVKQSPKKMLANLRTLVELGLEEDVALAGLTTTPASLLGSAGSLGKIEPGFAANIAIWSDSPFVKKSQLRWLLIDGQSFEYEVEEDMETEEPAEGVDLSGDWTIAYEDQSDRSAELTLTMEEDGSLEGVMTFQIPGGEKSKADLSGQLSGTTMVLKGSIEMGKFSAEMRIEGEVDGDTISGDATWKFSGGEDSNAFTATRDPKEHVDEYKVSNGHKCELPNTGEVR